MNLQECPNCSLPCESDLCTLVCGHFCCPGCSNPVCKVCNAPIQIPLPIVAAPSGGQAFVGKFLGLPHPFSASTYMSYPAKKKFVTPKHMRKRFKRGKRPEEVEEEDVNPDLFKFKAEDPKGNKTEKGTKRNVFLGQLETSENKMPALAGAARRSHYTTVMLVRKNNQFSCVYGDALKTLTFRQAVNYKTLDIDQAEAARKRQYKWSGSEKFAKISDRLSSRPATGLEAREALSEDRPKADVESKTWEKSTEADTPKVKKKVKTEDQPEESDDSNEEGENLDENGKRIESLMKEKKKTDKNDNDSDSSDSFDEHKLEDTSSESDSEPEQAPSVVKKRTRDDANGLDAKPKKVKAEEPIEKQVETYVRQLFSKQSGMTIRDLAKSVTAEFSRLDKANIKVLLAPILKTMCKYAEVGGVKLLTLADPPQP